MLPDNVTLDLFEAMQDQQITTAETAGMITSVFSSAISAMVMAFGMLMFNKVIKSNPGNPGNPGNPDGITSEVISRAGLKPYEYKYFPPPEEESKPRVYAYTRRRTIGSYEVQMTRTDDSCSIKLYEFLPGWKKKLRATWTGIGKGECDKKFLEVVEAVVQVRFEHKTALGR